MASDNNDHSDDEVETLTFTFRTGMDHYNDIVNSDKPTNSREIQMEVKKTMKIFEKATRLVSLSDLFSKNEGIEEIATNDLQYFLLPALLGSLTLKLTSGERKDIVDVAEIYFKDFLTRCNDYGLSNYQFGDKETDKGNGKWQKEKTEFEQIEMAVNTRANKIQREHTPKTKEAFQKVDSHNLLIVNVSIFSEFLGMYKDLNRSQSSGVKGKQYKEQRELKAKLEYMKANMENEHVDEEIKRNYFITMIKLFIYEAIDELNSINMEKPILEHMANMKKDDKLQPVLPPRPPPPPLKPIIITKDEMQKAVFGAGYPSLPTMTVQEFYDKRIADGIFPDPNKKKTGPMSLQETALAGISLDDEKEEQQKEKLLEEDDDEYIARMRAQDEYKDDHRRGWGNRMNRS